MDIEEQYDRLLRYCYMKLRDRSLAEDITQESFLRFLESRSYRNTGKEMAYLYTIAGNLCTDHYRKKKAENVGDAAELPEPESDMPELEERIAVEDALDRLPSDEREVIVLRYMAELPVGEIGRMLGLSRFAVYRRMASAMNRLKKEMEDVEKV